MALVGSDAGVSGWRNQGAHFGWRDEERLRPRTAFRLGCFAIYVANKLSSAILEYEKRGRRVVTNSMKKTIFMETFALV